MNNMGPMLKGLGKKRIRNTKNGWRNCGSFGCVIFEVTVMDGKIWPVLSKVDEWIYQTEK